MLLFFTHKEMRSILPVLMREALERRIDKLEALQKAVSVGAEYIGLIEIIELDERGSILCNEEGKLIGLMPNRRLKNDIICGVFYVTGQDTAGNLASLTDAQIEHYAKMFAGIEYFIQGDGDKIMVLRFI